MLNVKGMDKYVKVIPAATLACSSNGNALEEFLKFLDSDAAHKIWEDAGY